MLVRVDLTRERQALQVSPQEYSDAPARNDIQTKAELRRLLYERIARGNGLEEAEENARRMRRGQ